MNSTCVLHPTKPAHWTCPKCNSHFCSSCIVKREKGGYQKGQFLHLCPKCLVEADWVGVSNIIKPFWQVLPSFFSYPFSLYPLVLNFILSVALMLFSSAGPFFLIIYFINWAIILKYSFSALKVTVHGDLRPPPVNKETISEDFDQVFKQIAIYVAIGISLVFIMVTFGPIIGILFFLFAFLFIPSMLILLVVTNSFINAINPVSFIKLATRVGKGYLLMYLFLILIGGAPAYLFKFFYTYFPPKLFLLLKTFAANYYTIIYYHLMGYVILQYHEKIGYKVDFSDFKDRGATEEPVIDDEKTQMLNRINMLIKEGKHDEAIAFIKENTQNQRIDDVDLSDRYFNLLKMKNRTSELLSHGSGHLEILIQNGKKKEAIDTYSTLISIDASFIPSSSALFKLGDWLNQSNKPKESLGVFNKLVKSYPQDPLTPRAYFRAAQIISDRLLNKEKAIKMLNVVVSRYPDHEIIPHVKNYLSTI